MKISVKKLKEILTEINDNIPYNIFYNTLYDTMFYNALYDSRYNDNYEIDIMEILYYDDDRVIKITNVDEEELFAASVTSGDRRRNINILDKIIKTNIPGLIKCEDYRGAIYYIDLINYCDYDDGNDCDLLPKVIYFNKADLAIRYYDIKWDLTDDDHENYILILRAIKSAIDNKSYNTSNKEVRSMIDDAIDKMNKLPDSIKVLLEI